MKKTFALLLALCMVIGMAACGSSAPASDAPAESAAAPTEEAAPAEVAAPAEEATPAEEAEPAEATPETFECEPLEISFATGYNETETGGQIIQHFVDNIGQITNGAITVSVYWGGQLFSDMTGLDGVSSGSVNMTTLSHLLHIGTLNYLGFPGFAPGSPQAALDYFNELIFNNPDTSALIQGEAADNNLLFLNVIAGGANAFCTTYSFTDLDSMISGSKSFGNMDAAIFEALGFQVTSVGPGDTYDALQRGLIDSTQMALAPMVSMGWQDVADYWALDGTYTAGNMFTANLDWWNSLSDSQRAAIQAAAKEVEAYSASLYLDVIDEQKATVESTTGNPWVELSQADLDRIWAAVFEAKASAALSTAEPNGKTEGMTKILETAAEITSYNWAH